MGSPYRELVKLSLSQGNLIVQLPIGKSKPELPAMNQLNSSLFLQMATKGNGGQRAWSREHGALFATKNTRNHKENCGKNGYFVPFRVFGGHCSFFRTLNI
jgi:hypothetical protein